MADYAAETLDPPAAGEAAGDPAVRPGEMIAADGRPGEAIAAEMLVEEISIDGMCGVY